MKIITHQKQIKTRKHRKNKKQMKGGTKKVNCSPKPEAEINDFSCYTDKSLHKLKELWNARHPDAKITTNV